MYRLVPAATVMLCLSATAQGQTDTSRRRPLHLTVPGGPVSDTGLASDVENIVVLKFGALSDHMGAAVRRRMLDTLEAQRQIWDQRRPRAYIIRTIRISDCMDVRIGPRVNGELLRDRLLVRDTTIVKREPAPIPAAYEQRCPLDWRVDDLFAHVAQALADTTAYIPRIEYDAAYGFPQSYWLTHGHARGGGVLVESFAPAP